MTRWLILAALLTVLTGCNFDPKREMAACKAAYPGDEDAISVCFSRARNGHGIADVAASESERSHPDGETTQN